MSMTNEQLIDRFQKHLARNNASPKTIKSFISTIIKLSQTCNLISASSFDIEDFVDSMIAKGNSSSTVNQRISATKVFFTYINEVNVRSDNPSIAIKQLVNKEPKTSFDMFAIEDYKSIFSCSRVKPVDKILIGLSCFLGLRIEESTNVTVECIDFDNKQITVISGKGGKTETIALVDTMASMIKEYITDNNITSGYIININGNKISTDTARQRWSKVLKTVGLEHKKFHSNRHWCGSTLANNVSLTVAKNQLRHSSSRTTEMLYVHKDINAMISQVSNVMDNIF